MTGFELTPREYPHLPEIIVSELPDFANSPEYGRLSEADRTLPTVVCGAFGRYLNRLLSEDEGKEQQLQGCRQLMEKLAASPDLEVQNTLIVEVFEHLDLPVGRREHFRRELGPIARALYDRFEDG